MIRNAYLKFTAPGGASLTTAKPLQTGQTTSYRTGDDGDLQRGRLVDFFTLIDNNPFANTNRFTDTIGEQTYADGILIDWSTLDVNDEVLCYDTTIYGTNVWDDAIDGALALSTGSVTGWAVTNIRELLNLVDFSDYYGIGYAPFNVVSVFYLHSSTTTATGTANCLKLLTANNQFFADGKGNAAYWIACRYFTLAELGL